MSSILKDAIYFISVGLAIGFTLIVYAHSNFSTKEAVNKLETFQKDKEEVIIKRLDRIEHKLDSLISR